jgi:hypothetical protein
VCLSRALGWMVATGRAVRGRRAMSGRL